MVWFWSEWFSVFLSTGFLLAVQFQWHVYIFAATLLVTIITVKSVYHLARSSPEWTAFSLKAKGITWQTYFNVVATVQALYWLKAYWLVGAFGAAVFYAIVMRSLGAIKINRMSESEFSQFSESAIRAINAARNS